MLSFLAESKGEDKSKIAADILRRALLGEGHDLKVAAERFLRAGTSGRTRGMNDLELFTALILGVVGCGLAFCRYVIGVVAQEAPNFEISNVGDE